MGCRAVILEQSGGLGLFGGGGWNCNIAAPWVGLVLHRIFSNTPNPLKNAAQSVAAESTKKEIQKFISHSLR